MPGKDRIFSEEEIKRVLKRTAELQGKQNRPTGYGLTLLELQELAKESGLDPSLVEAAAIEMGSDDEEVESNWWGGPLSGTITRSIEGQISDETWEEMLGRVRREFKSTGETERRGSTLQWKLEAEGNNAHLIATQRKGRTEIELFWQNGILAVPMFVIPLVGSLISLPIVFEALSLSGATGAAVWFLIASTLFLGGRTGVTYASRSSRRDMVRVGDEVVAIAARANRERTSGTRPDVADQTGAPQADREEGPAGGAYLRVPTSEYDADTSRRESGATRREQE